MRQRFHLTINTKLCIQSDSDGMGIDCDKRNSGCIVARRRQLSI